MSRKLIWMISIFVLGGVLSGISYANSIPTQITLGPNTAGTLTASPFSASFSGGVSGLAYQGTNSGNPGYTIANASIPVISGGGGIFTLAPNSMSMTVVIGPDSLNGTLSLDTVAIPQPGVAFFVGTLTITSSSPGFQSTGFLPGSVAFADISALQGKVSTGELIPGVPEPGTIALVGSGLLAMAGLLRRRV